MRRAAQLDGWVGANYYPLRTALDLVRRLQQFRREAGTDGREDYGILVGLDHPPTIDDARRLEEAGVTAVWASPWAAGPSMDDPGITVVTDALKRYAHDVVQVIA